MRIKVSYYYRNKPQIEQDLQTDTLEWSSEEVARKAYAACNCEIVSWEIQLPARNTSQSSNYVKGSIKWDTDIPHPVDEVKSQYECENCYEGVQVDTSQYILDENRKCRCCNGIWKDCPNCKSEGCGNDTADLLAGMR